MGVPEREEKHQALSRPVRSTSAFASALGQRQGSARGPLARRNGAGDARATLTSRAARARAQRSSVSGSSSMRDTLQRELLGRWRRVDPKSFPCQSPQAKAARSGGKQLAAAGGQGGWTHLPKTATPEGQAPQWSPPGEHSVALDVVAEWLQKAFTGDGEPSHVARGRAHPQSCRRIGRQHQVWLTLHCSISVPERGRSGPNVAWALPHSGGKLEKI